MENTNLATETRIANSRKVILVLAQVAETYKRLENYEAMNRKLDEINLELGNFRALLKERNA
jgi:hypothetical protein